MKTVIKQFLYTVNFSQSITCTVALTVAEKNEKITYQ